MVPPEVIAEIRDRVDIVELVGGYVNLKKSGRNFQGLCPFHQEKTASFNVNPERQIYHCFGCGVTGDAYKFLQEHDHLSFPEALRSLADRAGIDLSPYEKPGRSASGSEFGELYAAHAIAVRLYRALLGKGEGKPAREEIERRGLSAEIVERYRLGASADAWDSLIKAARREGIRPEVLERAGLALQRDSGTGFYDRFRGRLMFPIETVGGKVIGFGGRILEDGEPKYLNSPESPLFRKRQVLYGYPQAMAELRETRSAVLVEGYTDVLSLANAGMEGVLASLGTSFTADHAQFLTRSCDRVTVLFDGDEAGRKAAYASCGPLLGAGLDVRMVMLPEGVDPDDLVRRDGLPALQERITAARGVVETLLESERYYDGGAALERAVRGVLNVIAPIRDPVRRKSYLEQLAITAGVRSGFPEKLLAEELDEIRRREAAAEHRSAARESVRGTVARPARVKSGEAAPPARTERRAAPAPAPAGRVPAVERTFVAVILHDPASGEELLHKYGADAFEHPLPRRVVEKVSEMIGNGEEVSAAALLEEFREDPVLLDFLGELCVAEEFTREIPRQTEDCLSRMEKRTLQREMEEVTREMHRAKARGDEALVLDFARKKNELARGIAALGTPRNSI